MPVSAFPSIGYAISASAAGKTSLPVSPSAYIYSHFRHVSGTPAPEGTRGVTITKLKILDTLIEQLNRLKAKPELSLGPESGNPDTEKRIDALITQYENQLRQVQASAPPYSPGIPRGALVSFTA
jgi:hypothetical protein